jgi:trk system potassium uptake protein
MHYPILFRLLGSIAWVITIVLTVSLGVALYYGDGLTVAIRGFVLCIAVSGSLALFLQFLGRNARNRVFRKEALCLIGLGWIMASLIGALPYLAIGQDVRFVDAVFESVSGFTTTGATVFPDYENQFPPSLLFWRSITQWVGGLGVVVLFVALMSNLGSGAKVLFSNESSGQSTEVEDSTMRAGARHMLYYYSGLSIAAALSYWWVGMPFFDAICHAATTVSTGGFSSRNAGVPAYENPALEWMMILFMFLGGFSFLLMLRVFRIGWRALRTGLEGVVYTAIFLVSSLLLAGINWATLESISFHELLRGACFQSITVMTTTGFASQDFELWAIPAKWVLLCLMVIGGCSGSTAGGVKVIRVFASIRMAGISIERIFRPHVVRQLRINGRVLDDTARESILTFLTLNALALAIGIVTFSVFEPYRDMQTGLSAVAACLFNIGPGFGDVGPMSNFAMLHDSTKIALSLLMLLGRLEFYALLVLFSPSLWRKFS